MDGETKYVYLNAQHSYDMLPSTEHLSVGKLTLCNNGTQTLLGRGGNHIGDYFLYEIDLTGSLLEPEVKTYEDLRIVNLLPDGIRYDLNNNGETNDKIAYAFSDATIIAAQSMYAEKFIAPAGSDSWSKQGLLVKAGSDFDYLLEIVNETAAVHTGLTVYDTLPRIGDPNLFGASGRGSEFPVRLRSAITPPEGNTVWARVCFAGFCVKKVNGATRAALPGAEFTLTDAAGTVVGTAVSDADGRLQFRELTEGTYTLAEAKVPDGFLDTHVSVAVTITQNPVTLAYSVTFSGDHTGLGTSADPLCIENHGAYVLPKTGGRGTAAFYVPGAFLLLSAALPDLRKRRSRKR